MWRDPKQASTAAETLRLTAQDLQKLGLIDRIIPEPVGGAQREPAVAIESVRTALTEELKTLLPIAPARLKELRREKFLAMGREALS